MKAVQVYLDDEDAMYIAESGYKYATIIRMIVNQWVQQKKARDAQRLSVSKE